MTRPHLGDRRSPPTSAAAPDPRREAVRAFTDRYGEPPEAVAFAPGRVNLIGEHLDYCGLPVLPAALRQGVALAFRRREDDRLRCASAEFPDEPADFRLGFGNGSGIGEAPAPPAGFARYLAAAATGLRAGPRFGARIGPRFGHRIRGFDGFLHSSLPPASGLSSSSAVVVAAALALLAANDRLAPENGPPPTRPLPPAERRRPATDLPTDLPTNLAADLAPDLPPDLSADLALDLAAAESGVAIRGGAMDQSVCLGAVPGHALLISAAPPARTPIWTPVPVPAARFAFLAAFSGQRAEKGASGGPAKRLYNARVVEAAAALAEAGRLFGGRAPASPGAAADLLAERPAGELLRIARRLDPPLDRRFRHLVTETRRVEEAVRCLRAADPERQPEEGPPERQPALQAERRSEGQPERLGALLDASHASLRDDYEVSTPELDALVREARCGGALGARLTGAGFGGSAVILSTPEARPALRAHLEKRFCAPRGLAEPDGRHLLDADPAGPAALFPAAAFL